MSGSGASDDTKVISADQLDEALALGEPETQALIADLIAPTADDLLALTLAAVDDIEGTLPLTPVQRNALSDALRRRLLGAVLPTHGDQAIGR